MKNIISLAKSLLEDEDTACVVYLDQSVYLRFEPAATAHELTMHYKRCSFKDHRQFESLKKYFYQKLNFLFGKVVENTDSYILGTVDMLSDEEDFESKCAPSGVERFAMGDTQIRSVLDDIGISYYGEENMNESKFFENVFKESNSNYKSYADVNVGDIATDYNDCEYKVIAKVDGETLNAVIGEDFGMEWDNDAEGLKVKDLDNGEIVYFEYGPDGAVVKSHLNENTTSKITNATELLQATKEGMNAILIFSADMMLYSYINSSGRVVPIYYNLDLGGEDSPHFEALKDHLKDLTLKYNGKILSNDNASNFVAEFSKGHILESSNIFEDLALEYSSGDRQYLTIDDLENINLNANDLENWSK